jgi:hypothetical protein
MLNKYGIMKCGVGRMKVGFKSKSAERNSESGFSLIEVAIGLLVLSLLMTPILYAYNIQLEIKRKAVTEGSVDMVRAAVLKFYEREGFYPNPATPNIGIGTANFGAPAVMPVGGWPACTATSTVVCRAANSGTFGVSGTGTPPTPATDGVIIGSVPVAALGLPHKMMLDGYGNRLTYAVSQNLTIELSFLDSRGALKIRDNAAATTQAHFIVISHGKTGMGAFTLGGGRGLACNTSTAPVPIDHENCDNDDVFSSNYIGGSTRLQEAVGTTFFDDSVKFINTTAYGIWSYIPNTSLNMQAKNEGNVRIGCPATGECKPTSKLDVDGNVRATELQTSRFCTSGNSQCITSVNAAQTALEAPSADSAVSSTSRNWFSPRVLTAAPDNVTAAMTTTFDSDRSGYRGSGIRCYGETGTGFEAYALKGINAYDEVCAGNGSSTMNGTPVIPSTSVTIAGCGPNLFARELEIVAVNEFRFICVPPP